MLHQIAIMLPVTQLNITVPNVPSSLAKVCDKLRAADINIDAITVTEGRPTTIIHLIVDDTETAKIILKEIGPVTTTEAISFKLKNKQGVIASFGRACAGAGLNIGKIYSTTAGKDAMVYVTVEDMPKAMALLKTWKDNSEDFPS